MLKRVTMLTLCLSFTLFASNLTQSKDKYLFKCDAVQGLYIPDFYKWVRSSKLQSVETVIRNLDRIPYASKISRLQNFCETHSLVGVKWSDINLTKELVEHVFYDRIEISELEHENYDAEYTYPLHYNNNMPFYAPYLNQPELSWAFEHRKEDRQVFLSKTRLAPNQWQETCLSVGLNNSVEFVDCYASGATQLNLHFQAQTSKFQIRHGLQCLSRHDSFEWEYCDKNDLNQYFQRETPLHYKAGSYLMFQLRHVVSNEIAFNGEYVHFRDAFPLLPISAPIQFRKSSDQIDEFLNSHHFGAERKPDIVLIWLDTVRADAVSPSVMPNLYAFSQESISFKQTFASGSSTRPTGYAVWNSRPATEWAYGLRNEFKTKGTLNPKILEKLGYKVHAIGGELAPIDEKIFSESGSVFDEENPDGKRFFHREYFSFRTPKEKREIEASCILAKEEYERIIHVEKDKELGISNNPATLYCP